MHSNGSSVVDYCLAGEPVTAQFTDAAVVFPGPCLSDHALLSMRLAWQKQKQKRKPNRGRKQWNRRRMYDEDAVEQEGKMLAESMTSGDIEEDVNATGKAFTAVICSTALKCFGQRAPFGRRAYWWTD